MFPYMLNIHRPVNVLNILKILKIMWSCNKNSFLHYRIRIQSFGKTNPSTIVSVSALAAGAELNIWFMGKKFIHGYAFKYSLEKVKGLLNPFSSLLIYFIQDCFSHIFCIIKKQKVY